MRAMMIKEFRELFRDRRTLALLIFIPLFLLLIFGYAANFSIDTSRVLVAGPNADALVTELFENEAAKENFDIVRVDPALTKDDIEGVLRTGEYEAVIYVDSDDKERALSLRTHLWVDGSQLFPAQAAQKNWMSVLADDSKTRIESLRSDITSARSDAEKATEKLNTLSRNLEDLRAALANPTPGAPPQLPDDLNLDELPELPDVPNTDVLDMNALDIDSLSTSLFNPDLKTSWVMVPGLIGLILTFVGVIVTSIGLVREREMGTLEQLSVMPLSPASIVLGKISPYFVVAFINALFITAMAVWIFEVPFVGALWRFIVVALIFLFVVLGLGVLISSISETTGQAIQLAIMVMMPQVLLSGLIFPLRSMAAGVRWIGYCLPLTWFVQCGQGIMLRDATLTELSMPLAILGVMAVVIFGAATARMTLILRRGGATR
ncbi:MAG: ABC transporter [Actinobacteria bacterium]|nr:MAG: ABC transporter [Actinomycetota bacterium]